MDEQHLAVSHGPSFEELLAHPNEQFDLRSELLASILSYAAAPPASAGAQTWSPTVAAGTPHAWLRPASRTGSTTGATAA